MEDGVGSAEYTSAVLEPAVQWPFLQSYCASGESRPRLAWITEYTWTRIYRVVQGEALFGWVYGSFHWRVQTWKPRGILYPAQRHQRGRNDRISMLVLVDGRFPEKSRVGEAVERKYRTLS